MRERPAILTGVAIANMVFGGLSLICGFCGLVGGAVGGMANAMGPPPGRAGAPVTDPVSYIQKQIPSYQAVEIGTGALLLILGIILVVAGIGLLLVHSWGRWLTVAYALLTGIVTLDYILYKIIIVKPVAERAMQVMAQQQGRALAPGEASGFTCGFFGALLGTTLPFTLYALVVLVLMFLPAISAAFAAPRKRRRREDDEEDYDDRPKRGRRVRDEDDEDEGRFRRREDRDY